MTLSEFFRGLGNVIGQEAVGCLTWVTTVMLFFLSYWLGDFVFDLIETRGFDDDVAPAIASSIESNPENARNVAKFGLLLFVLSAIPKALVGFALIMTACFAVGGGIWMIAGRSRNAVGPSDDGA